MEESVLEALGRSMEDEQPLDCWLRFLSERRPFARSVRDELTSHLRRTVTRCSSEGLGASYMYLLVRLHTVYVYEYVKCPDNDDPHLAAADRDLFDEMGGDDSLHFPCRMLVRLAHALILWRFGVQHASDPAPAVTRLLVQCASNLSAQKTMNYILSYNGGIGGEQGRWDDKRCMMHRFRQLMTCFDQLLLCHGSCTASGTNGDRVLHHWMSRSVLFCDKCDKTFLHMPKLAMNTCSGCLSAFYCGRVCQKASHTRHKNHCTRYCFQRTGEEPEQISSRNAAVVERRAPPPDTGLRPNDPLDVC